MPKISLQHDKNSLHQNNSMLGNIKAITNVIFKSQNKIKQSRNVYV